VGGGVMYLILYMCTAWLASDRCFYGMRT
jgi:hypothetical protein